MKRMILAVLLAATAASARADEVSAAQEADMKCFLGMTVMAQNETYKQWAQFGIFFYTGRLKGRDPTVDLKEQLKRVYPLMRPAAYNDEIKRCNDELGQVSRDLESLKRAVPRGAGR